MLATLLLPAAVLLAQPQDRPADQPEARLAERRSCSPEQWAQDLDQLAADLPAKHKNGLLVASRFSIEGLPGSAPNTHGLSARWIDAWLPQANLHLTGLHIPDDSHPTARATC